MDPQDEPPLSMDLLHFRPSFLVRRPYPPDMPGVCTCHKSRLVAQFPRSTEPLTCKGHQLVSRVESISTFYGALLVEHRAVLLI